MKIKPSTRMKTKKSTTQKSDPELKGISSLLNLGESRKPAAKKSAAKFHPAYTLKPTAGEIDDQLSDAEGWEELGKTAVRGMTYEQGVLAAIRWMIGETEEPPIEEMAPEEEE